MEKKYKALRIIGSTYKVLGIILAVLTALTALFLCGTTALGGAFMDSIGSELGTDSGLGLFSGIFGGLFMAGITILYGGGSAITLYAFGEGIYLFLAIEENTRTTAEMLKMSDGL